MRLGIAMWWLLIGALALDAMDKVDALERRAKKEKLDAMSDEEKKERNELYARVSALNSPWSEYGGFIV